MSLNGMMILMPDVLIAVNHQLSGSLKGEVKMKCYGLPNFGGICVQRQGKVLSEYDLNHLEELTDKDICKHRSGYNCICAGVETETDTREDVVEIKVKDENEPLDDGDIFDAFFGD